MAKKSVKRNYVYNLLYQLLVILIPIITTPYISRVLGATGIGIYSYTISITMYFVMLGTLGVSSYGQREIAYVQEDKEARSKLFFELFVLRMVSTLVSTLVFFILFARVGEYAIYYRILILELLAQVFDITWFFQGLEEFEKVVLRNIIIKIIFVCCIFIFVRNASDVWLYLLLYAMSAVIGNLTLWINLKKYITPTRRMQYLKHLKPMLLLFLPQIAIQVYTVLDKTMLGTILNDMNIVGYYEQAQKIVKISLTVITSLGTVMVPRISSIYAKGDINEIKEQLLNSFRFVWLLGFPIIFGLIAVSSHFVPLFYGEGFAQVKDLIIVFTILIPIIGLANVIGVQYLLPTKQQNKYTLAVIFAAFVNVILNFILIPRFEALGASIATIVAEFIGLLIQICFVWKEFDFKKILKLAPPYIVSSIIMFIICYIIGITINSNFLAVVLQILIGIIVYFSCLILLRDVFVINFLRKVKLNVKVIKRK